MKASPKIFLIIIILTFFSIIVYPGYKVFSSDQEIYLPFAYNHVDKGLFTQDIVLKFNVLQYSLFDELIAFLFKFSSNIFYIIFFIYVVTRFIFFYALFKIALYFTEDEKFSILSLLLFVPAISVYGTQLFDNLLIPRVIGFSLGLLALAYFFEKKYFTSVILLSLHYLIHPLTAFFFLSFYYLNLIFNFEKKKFFNTALFIPGIIPVVTFFLSMLIAGQGLGFFTFIDKVWNEIILLRWPSFYISGWNYTLFMVLFTSLFVFLIGLDSYRDRIKKVPLTVLFYLPLFMTIVSFFAADILKFHFIAQLQIYRSLVFVKIFGGILFFRMVYVYIKKNPKDIFYNFFMLGTVFALFINEDLIYPFFYTFLYLWIKRRYDFKIIKKSILNYDFTSLIIFLPLFLVFFFIVKNLPSFSFLSLILVFIAAIIFTVITYFKKDFSFKPLHVAILFVILIMIYIFSFTVYSPYNQDKGIIASCNWIKENTPKDSLFIAFPDKLSRPIRLMCLRSVFVSGREGSSSLFDRSFAFEWKKRMDLYSISYGNISLIKPLVKEYNLDYLFSNEKLNFSYPLVFSNGTYYIYKLQ